MHAVQFNQAQLHEIASAVSNVHSKLKQIFPGVTEVMPNGNLLLIYALGRFASSMVCDQKEALADIRLAIRDNKNVTEDQVRGCSFIEDELVKIAKVQEACTPADQLSQDLAEAVCKDRVRRLKRELAMTNAVIDGDVDIHPDDRKAATVQAKQTKTRLEVLERLLAPRDQTPAKAQASPGVPVTSCSPQPTYRVAPIDETKRPMLDLLADQVRNGLFTLQGLDSFGTPRATSSRKARRAGSGTSRPA